MATVDDEATRAAEREAFRANLADALRESEEKYRTLFESIDQGFCVFEMLYDDAGRPVDYRFIEVNPAFEKHTGLVQAQGKTIRELVPDHEEHWFEIYGNVVATGEPVRFENRGEGMHRWFDVYAFRLGGPGSRKVAAIFSDITQRRHAEEVLRNADRHKDEFLATLAHELRNPLAPLRNGLELMKRAKSDPEAVEQARTMMERQLSQMVHLIDDLMDMSRISQGKVELRKRRVDLAGIVQQAVETSRPLIEDRGHELVLDVPDDPIHVDADVTRLTQVFSNLLNNAARYTDRGGRIRLSVVRRNGDAVVSVEDNGAGIPAHMLSKVFDIFTQVDRSLEKTQDGLGIGLSLVRTLVTMHGGSVEARSDGQDRGSEFIVTLPVASALEPEVGSIENERSGGAPVARRILVADDNVDAASSLAMLLDLMGHEVRTAHDGLQAVELAASFVPDMALLDIGMPGLSGLEACRRIHEQPGGRSMVLVALTGWGQDDDKRQTKEAGFDHHIVKPVSLPMLDELLAGLDAR